MKKRPALLFAILLMLLITASTVMAENGGYEASDESEAGPPPQIIYCPEQGFSALCPDWCEWEYKENVGVTVDIPDEDRTLWVRICRLETGADFDPDDYFLNTVTPTILGYLGNRAIEIGQLMPYEVGDREMRGKEYAFNLTRDTKWLLVLDDTGEDVVRYDVWYTEDKEATVRMVLDRVARSYQPDPEHYFTQYTDMSKYQKELADISCPEMGFSTKADPAYSWDYQEGTGISIYTGTEGSIPYVIIYKSEDLIAEPGEFIREQLTPYIREQYGDNLLDVIEYKAYVIGGKELAAAEYKYLVQGKEVTMLRLLDSSGSTTISYTAKYLEEDAKKTVGALETAIKNFR